jgi:GR25 family glycosyltransferase involved in LPS biosynthesis
MQLYVLNLANRNDRWASVERQSEKYGLSFNRIDAVDMASMDARYCEFMPPGVVATWKSHQLAFSRLLDSSDDFCLIFEDDFVLNKKSTRLIQKISHQSHGFDFLQLGFLVTSSFEKLDVSFHNFVDLSKKFLYAVSVRYGNFSFYSKKLSVREQANVPTAIVLNDVRAGGHAYMVSRKFARAGLEMNNPVFYSTDGVYMALGKSRAFKMGRFRKSLISQSDSPTSVLDRFI